MEIKWKKRNRETHHTKTNNSKIARFARRFSIVRLAVLAVSSHRWKRNLIYEADRTRGDRIRRTMTKRNGFSS